MNKGIVDLEKRVCRMLESELQMLPGLIRLSGPESDEGRRMTEVEETLRHALDSIQASA
jgi:hypothetical protein